MAARADSPIILNQAEPLQEFVETLIFSSQELSPALRQGARSIKALENTDDTERGDRAGRGGLVAACVQNKVKVTVGVLLVLLFGMHLAALDADPADPRSPGADDQHRDPMAGRQPPGGRAADHPGARGAAQERRGGLEDVLRVVRLEGGISLEFPVGTNMEEALLKVNTRLQQVPEYPIDADEPVVSTSSLADRPIAWFILGEIPPTNEVIRAFEAEHPDLADVSAPAIRTSHIGLKLRRLRLAAADHPEIEEILPEPIDVPKLRRFAEDMIEARFERVTGVSNSDVMGGREVEMQVIVDPERLAARFVDDCRCS